MKRWFRISFSAQGKGVQVEGHDWATAEQQVHNDTSLQVIEVSTMQLNDIVFGFGRLTESLAQHRNRYVLFDGIIGRAGSNYRPAHPTNA